MMNVPKESPFLATLREMAVYLAAHPAIAEAEIGTMGGLGDPHWVNFYLTVRDTLPEHTLPLGVDIAGVIAWVQLRHPAWYAEPAVWYMGRRYVWTWRRRAHLCISGQGEG